MNTDELAQITIPNSIGIAKLDTALPQGGEHGFGYAEIGE